MLHKAKYLLFRANIRYRNYHARQFISRRILDRNSRRRISFMRQGTSLDHRLGAYFSARLGASRNDA